MRVIPRGIIGWRSSMLRLLPMSSSLLFLLIPLFSIALLILALSHSPGHPNPKALLSYTYIASLTLLSTLAGALPLTHSSNSFSEPLIQALLFPLIGIPVLHLAPTYVPHLSIRTLHTSVLVITLSIATLLALINPFLPTPTPLLYISPSLFLLYTLQAIPRIAYILHNFLYPEDSIQLTLPSPASTTSFPLPTNETRKHHRKIPSVISTTSTITIVDHTRIPSPRPPLNDQLRSQILNSRSRSLLVFVFAVQVAALVANACALGLAIAPTNAAALRTVQTICTVLAITGSMSAYLLHTYNLHLRQAPITTTTSNSNYDNLSTHSSDPLQIIESQHPHSPMLIQLAPPPLPRTRRKRTNAGVSMEIRSFNRNDETNPNGKELELDLVMDIGRYSMTTTTGLGLGSGSDKRTVLQDSIDLGLALVSSPASAPVLPVPLPLRVSVEEGSRCGSWGGVDSGAGGTLENKEKQKESEKEKIQGYYLSTSSPSSPFGRYGMETETETDPSSPDTPYPNAHLHNAHTPVRKRSSFFGWEFAWDQEALERADDAGKLRSGGGSPVRWKSDVNVDDKLLSDTSKKIQSLLVVDDESFMDIGGDRESFGPSLSLPGPHSLSSEVEGGVKKGLSWRSSVCGVVDVGGEKVKRLGLGIGMKPLRLSRSFGGNGTGMGHRTVFSGDVGPMCGLSLKKKTTALFSGRGSPSAVSSRVLDQGKGNGDATTTIVAAAAAITTPKRLKKKTKPGHPTAGTAASEMDETNSKNSIDNRSIESIHRSSRNLDSDDDDLDEDTDLQKTPTMKWRTTTRSYSHSPQSYHYSSSSSPNQQQYHEAAISESPCSSIDKSTITTAATTITMNSPTKLSPSLTRRGLSFKRSFKMGSTVGRTLGPGLTLSSASLSSSPGPSPGPSPGANFTSGSGIPLTSISTSTSASASVQPYAHKSIRRCESEGFGFGEEDEKLGCEEKRDAVCKEGKGNVNLDDGKKVGGEDVDVDVEAEMKSIVGARVVSASYARATAAPTILTPATGGVGVGVGGLAPRSGGSSNPANATTKSMLHSRPSLPTMNTTTTSASVSSYSTSTQRYQHQDGYNSAFSMTASRWYSGQAWKPHPTADQFGPLEVSNPRGGDVFLGQGMRIKGSGTGNDDDRSSLIPPPSPLPPPMTPPLQSRSLPPTPTKSRPTVLSKPSIGSFKKRSAPPTLPPPPESLEWALFPHSMSTMKGAEASSVSLVHSRSHSGSQSVVGPGQTISKPPSRPTTPRPSTRLSGMNMGTVRSAFAGVGAKMSARMSINSASTRGSASVAGANAVPSSMGKGMDDIDRDFMDLRDPFAPPQPFKLTSVFKGGDDTGGDFWVSERAMSCLRGRAAGAGDDDVDDAEVGVTRRMSGRKRRVNMNAWGRLPMPMPMPSTRPTSPLPGSTPGTSSASVSSLVASRKKAHSLHAERRKHKEKRARKAAAAAAGVLGETNVSLNGYSAPSDSPACHAGEEDVDFGVEEALLSQRLLRRLDSIEWD